MIWSVALLKGAVGLIGRALTRGWPLPAPGWIWLLISWGAGVVLSLYGLMNILYLLPPVK